MLVSHFKLKIIFIRVILAMMQNQTKVAWTVCEEGKHWKVRVYQSCDILDEPL